MTVINNYTINTGSTAGSSNGIDFGQSLSQAMRNGTLSNNGLPANLQPHFETSDLTSENQDLVENLQDDLTQALKDSGIKNAGNIADQLTQQITDALGAAERSDEAEQGGECGGSGGAGGSQGAGGGCGQSDKGSKNDKTNQTLDKMLDKLDKNKDGEASLDELLKGLEKADKNNDGKLSNRELKKMAKDLGTNVNDLKDMLDADGDGTMSLQESQDLADDVNGGGIYFDDNNNGGITY